MLFNNECEFSGELESIGFDTKRLTAAMLAMNADHMKEVTVQRLGDDLFDEKLRDKMVVKGCYANALIAAIGLQVNNRYDHDLNGEEEKAVSVVIGATFLIDANIGIEHAFLKLGDQYFDPTFEEMSRRYEYNENFCDFPYYSLLEIPMDEYYELMEELDTGDFAICVTSLRRSPRFKHLFPKYDQFSELLKTMRDKTEKDKADSEKQTEL